MNGPIRIDREEYQQIISELSSLLQSRLGDEMLITGNHEDHGAVKLTRIGEQFFVEADEVSFIRPWGTPEPSEV